MSNENENVKNESGKVEKAYQKNLRQIVALVGGQAPVFGSSKVPQNEVGSLVEELLKERKENLGKEIKTELGALLDAHVKLKKEIKVKEQELKQLEEKKKKEFNEAAKKVLGKIEGLNEIERDYYQSLGGVNEVSTPVDEQDEEDDDKS